MKRSHHGEERASRPLELARGGAGKSRAAPAGEGAVAWYSEDVQQHLKARVRNGRLTLDEPTNLPEGAEVQVVITDGDDLDDDERAELHQAIEEGLADMKAGRTVDAKEVIARLRSRS